MTTATQKGQEVRLVKEREREKERGQKVEMKHRERQQQLSLTVTVAMVLARGVITINSIAMDVSELHNETHTQTQGKKVTHTRQLE